MFRLDEKLARIRSGQYKRSDFIIADAKDPDMGPSLAAAGPKLEPDGSWTRYRSREEFLDQIVAIVEQDIVDVMLTSASNLERLVKRGLFASSKVKPVIRANDTTDIWLVRGGSYPKHPSRPFRSASLPQVMYGANVPVAGGKIYLTDLGLYSITFTNDVEADIRSLEAFSKFRDDASACDFPISSKCSTRTSTPKSRRICCRITSTISSCARCPGWSRRSGRVSSRLLTTEPGAGGTRLLRSQPDRRAARRLGRNHARHFRTAGRRGGQMGRGGVFGRKINRPHPESPLAIIKLMRAVTDGAVSPAEAVKAYHGELQKSGLKPKRPLAEDNVATEAALK